MFFFSFPGELFYLNMFDYIPPKTIQIHLYSKAKNIFITKGVYSSNSIRIYILE